MNAILRATFRSRALPRAAPRSLYTARIPYRPYAPSWRQYSTTPPESPPPPPSQAKIEPRVSLTCTCTVPNCGHRSTHKFTRASYDRGIVIITCPACKNRHLIADHLGWFKDTEGAESQGRTIEDFMRAKGEKVTRGRVGEGGAIEYVEEDK